MKYVTLKKTGLKISCVSLGTWAFGGGDYWGHQRDDAQSFSTIDKALELGINLFDSAESYNDGESELVLGNAMQGRRDKFIVSTKVYLDKLGAKELVKTCEDSLRRLNTDYIDVLSPHFASKEIPFEETFGTLERLKKQGKVRSIGLSNFGIEAMQQLERLHLLDQIEMNQLPYSLLWRAIEFDIQEAADKYSMGIVCYSTLAQGLLSGQYENAGQVPANFKVLRLFEPGVAELVFPTINELKKLCAEAGLDMPPAVLNWLFHQDAVASLLTGATTPALLEENVKCLDMTLPHDVVKQMAEITRPLKEKLGANADMWVADADSRIY